MSNKKSDLSLEGKMDDWGPFGKNEGKWSWQFFRVWVEFYTLSVIVLYEWPNGNG